MSPVDVDRKAADWLTAADDSILACRGAGRHSFDKLRRDRPLPNTRTVPVERDGVALIVQTCPDCGLVEREMLTGPRSRIELPAKWRYRRDPRYSAPKGVRVTSRMALAETVRRMNEDGWRLAGAAPLPERGKGAYTCV